MIEIDFDQVSQEIAQRKPGRVLLQIPEGLKAMATEIVMELEKRFPAEYITLVEPCFGACDLADEKAVRLQADLLVHFGHNQMYEGKIPTIYFPLPQKTVEERHLKELVMALTQANVFKIGLCASVQYTGLLQKVADYLEDNDFQTFAGQGNARVKELGQVLGCNYSCIHALGDEVDAIVYVGDGSFHPVGISFVSKKKLFTFNPLQGEIKELKDERDRFLRQRFAILSQCGNAHQFGVIVSTKMGQGNINRALELKKMIERKGKKAFLLTSDYVFPEYFAGLKVDCYVNAACPRIAIEEGNRFNKMIINPSELEIALNYKKMTDFKMDELV
jgi:2-(3-amino-3-carboxypropyl)histidine synthase